MDWSSDNYDEQLTIIANTIAREIDKMIIQKYLYSRLPYTTTECLLY